MPLIQSSFPLILPASALFPALGFRVALANGAGLDVPDQAVRLIGPFFDGLVQDLFELAHFFLADVREACLLCHSLTPLLVTQDASSGNTGNTRCNPHAGCFLRSHAG